MSRTLNASPMTPSETRSFNQWLSMVDGRCVMLTGENLDSIAERLESSGKLDASGIAGRLAGRWRTGCAGNRALRELLAEVEFADPFRMADEFPSAGFGRFLAVVDHGIREAIDTVDAELLADVA